MIHVCSLRHVPRIVTQHDIGHVVTLISEGNPLPSLPTVTSDQHLKLYFHDIIDPREGMIPPSSDHAQKLIDFVLSWDRSAPMLIHCWAGISRSTAAMFIALCARNPDTNEQDIASILREASPTATPNSRLIAYGDALLKRDGRMIRAIETIGRGETAFEGEPFYIKENL